MCIDFKIGNLAHASKLGYLPKLHCGASITTLVGVVL